MKIKNMIKAHYYANPEAWGYTRERAEGTIEDGWRIMSENYLEIGDTGRICPITFCNSRALSVSQDNALNFWANYG